MVTFSTRFTCATAFAPLASTAAIKTWEEYHAQNDAFSRQGLCLVYLSPSPRDGTWSCGVYCNNDKTKICTGLPADQITEDLIRLNPDGEKFQIGQCECDTSTVDFFATATVDFVGKGLDKGFRETGTVTCEIMLNVVKEAALAATYAIPGTRQVAAAARVAAKGVKQAAKSQGRKDSWKDAVQSSCNFRRDENQKLIFVEGYAIMEGTPDDI
ncbi:hypothetical protein NW762_011940 [Fusarium torreyae]|uniref:Uncharacterized protein n=1 Tax=Fusarium torreyae TaxID=1237075 RepID=A0A9W8RRA4_9HYPO|nr:hypothetical protein NW762_011940 [Fusarium torreyae]